jgi:hypothetical protein
MAVQQDNGAVGTNTRTKGERRKDASRRPPGMGSLLACRDGAGRETWYGKWSVDGIQIKRRVGPKRKAGTREGLTRAQAETKLRELMSTVEPSRPVSDALTMDDLGRRYLAHLARRGRKKGRRSHSKASCASGSNRSSPTGTYGRSPSRTFGISCA